ncbi:MAG TPA: MerR family transcriptional regulator [Candidatus Methylomirabilis sp.]
MARRTGMSLRTIRYYESLRLIKPEARTPGGQRLYSEHQFQRLCMIRDLRTLDVPLREIRELLQQRKTARTGAEAVRGVARVFGKGFVEATRRACTYGGIKQGLSQTLQMMQTCARCTLSPVPEVCLRCPLVTKRSQVPPYFAGLLA